MALKYVKPERVWLKGHAELTERWVQERIAEDPSLLGLGDLVLKDRERMQPKAGRLDLLLQEPESNRRYEVEIQLGKTDESHIIRTIEYWDIERRRYPQYDHTAVIVAEDITSRFLNIIALFNGFIPLVAIQLQAYAFGADVSLVFTTVLDQVRLGLVEEDEEDAEVVDRSYWEKRAGKGTLEVVDRIVSWLAELDPRLTATYKKVYIGLARDGRANNFVSFQPKKEWFWLGLRLEKSEEVRQIIESAGLERSDYDPQWGKYWIRLTKGDTGKSEQVLQGLVRRAYDEAIR
jgi:hypothetical protein